jgi:hypothetical protein
MGRDPLVEEIGPATGKSRQKSLYCRRLQGRCFHLCGDRSSGPSFILAPSASAGRAGAQSLLVTLVEAPGSVSTLETHVAGPGLSCEPLPAFIPMTIAPNSPERLAAPSASAAIAISFGLNISMKIEGAPDTGTLAHVLNVLSTSAARR